jgi:hypothetical protein
MSWPVEKILEEVLKLDPEDRALIAAELSEPAEDPEEVRRAWVRVAVERLEKLERGEAVTVGSDRYAQDSPGTGRLEQDAPERFDLRWCIVQRFPYALAGAPPGYEPWLP